MRWNVHKLAKQLTITNAVLTGLLAVISLYTWHSNGQVPGFILSTAMVYNTALCFLILSIVILLNLSDRWSFFTRLLTMIILSIGLISLLEHFTNKNLHIDQLFFHGSQLMQRYPQGRISPNSAINFVLASLALLALSFKWPKQFYILINSFVGLLILTTGTVFLSGYIVGIKTIYTWGSLPPITLQANISFMFLGISLTAFAFYQSMSKQINTIDILPPIAFVCLLLVTLLYWRALNVQPYLSTINIRISIALLIIGIIIAVLVSLTLRYAIIAYRKAIAASFEAFNAKNSLSLVEATLESTADGILVINQISHPVKCNKKFIQMWKISGTEIINNNKIIEYMIQQLDSPEIFVRKTKELEKFPQKEMFEELKFKDGRVFEFYSKPQLLEGKIIGQVWSFRDVTERKIMEQQIIQQATHDPVSNLPNRLVLIDRLQRAIIKAKYNKEIIAVVFLDIDQFKQINNRLGHEAGDILIKETAQRLLANIKSIHTVSHLGGDVFVIKLTALKHEEDCLSSILHIKKIIAEPFIIKNQEIRITSSIGVSFYPKDSQDVDTLLKNANAAMYSAKLKGRDNLQFFTSEINTLMEERIALENDLRAALERNEFLVYYQPIFNLADSTLNGFEALIRWQHPKKGLLLPQKFIHIAEETNLINSMGNWVLETACLQLKQWQESGLPHVRMAVNLSMQQFNRPDFNEKILNLLQKINFDFRDLEIELTESMLFENSSETIAKLFALTDLGIKISIDDFGTGYSSLSYLTRFPVNKLKIDKSFISDIDNSAHTATIVKTIISMAKSLQIKTLAEGIETLNQLNFLIEQQCDEGQGYYFSMPLPAEECTLLLEKMSNKT